MLTTPNKRKEINHCRATNQRGEKNHKNKITAINKQLSLTTLNSYGLNTPIRRHRQINGLQKEDLSFSIQKMHINIIDRHHLIVKVWKKYSKQMDLSRNSFTKQKPKGLFHL